MGFCASAIILLLTGRAYATLCSGLELANEKPSMAGESDSYEEPGFISQAATLEKKPVGF